MIYLTYYYDRDVFNGNQFRKWIIDLFGSNVKFNGSEGRRFPEIEINLSDFESKKNKIPLKNLVNIEGRFTIIEQIAFGVRDFKNVLG